MHEHDELSRASAAMEALNQAAKSEVNLGYYFSPEGYRSKRGSTGQIHPSEQLGGFPQL
jgi:hypothetical protein